MKRFIRTCLLTVLLGGLPAIPFAAWAGTNLPADTDWDTIRTVITAQLDAFKRDDAITAFSLAAPSIRSQFRTPGKFMQMVRTGYNAVYRPRSVRFLKHLMVLGRPVQPLEVITQEDAVTVAYYVMEQQQDGSWKIAGCSLKGSPGISV